MTLKGHNSGVTSCVFSPNGERVATTSEDGTAQLWDAETSEPQMSLEGHDYYVVTSCAFSPDGTRVVTASDDKTARICDAETCALLMTLEVPTHCVVSCAFSSDGRRIVIASTTGRRKSGTPIQARCRGRSKGTMASTAARSRPTAPASSRQAKTGRRESGTPRRARCC